MNNEYEYGFAIGANAGKWAKKNLDCHGKVILLTQDRELTLRARADGATKGLRSQCPKIKIVSRLHADDPFRGMMLTNLTLQRFPDANMIVATTDSGGLGGYIVFLANNFGDSKHAIFSGDATPYVLEVMQEDNSVYRGTVDIRPHEVGYKSTKIVYKMIQEGVGLEPVVEKYTLVPITQEQIQGK